MREPPFVAYFFRWVWEEGGRFGQNLRNNETFKKTFNVMCWCVFVKYKCTNLVF